MTLEQQRVKVRTELEKIYPQLVINARNTCGAGYNKHGDDLLAMCIEFYLEKPIEYQLKVIDDGKLENFITHMMGFQLKLGTTKYFHHYRKFSERMREFFPGYAYAGENVTFPKPFEDEPSELMMCMKQVIDKLNPYEKMIVDELIINKQKYSYVSKKYKIAYGHLKKDKVNLIKKIKQSCQHWR
jgi:hypothetical protein